MKLLRYILFPVVPFYYLVTWLRNKCYDLGVFKSTSYNFPVICVGNLSVGGTGKTPMIEYLIRLLSSEYKLATLSRGYKRKTDGFIVADTHTTVADIGDEPFQFYNKFKDVIVSVDANRVEGIAHLRELATVPEVVLLDDAFQHRKVKAGFYIMLTAYDKLYATDFVLPTGDLREPRSGAKRANIIVVTKCPTGISVDEKNRIKALLQVASHQTVVFSEIMYANTMVSLKSEEPLAHLKDKPFTLVTGIAKAQPLVDYLKAKGLEFQHMNFKDHHDFTEKEICTLKAQAFILTTEKDFMRLSADFKSSKTPLFYLPIEVQIDELEVFNTLVKTFVSKN